RGLPGPCPAAPAPGERGCGRRHRSLERRPCNPPEPPMAAYQYIYVMKGLTKIYPGGRKVLENIWLSFFPGAKIGVLGLNGAGKSTLLKIMGGLDKDVGGENWAAEGVSVGYLHQEPQLDPAKDVQGNVLMGMASTVALLDRYDEISARLGEEITAE